MAEGRDDVAAADDAGSETDVLSATEFARPRRRPSYKDPLSIIGWGIALASIVAYWYFFVRKPVPKPGQQIARLTGVVGRVKVKPNAKEAWALKDLRRKARRLLWICPEERRNWGFGDSEMLSYSKHCDQVVVVQSVSDLARIAQTLVPA